MSRLLIAMATASTLAIAAPAAAQYPYQANVQANTNFNANFDQRLDALQTRLDAGIRSGAINRAEARTLRAQLRTLNRLHGNYAMNGITRQERQDLQLRLRNVRQEMRVADNGAYDRYERYGANDEFYGEGGNYGRGGPYDSDGDGWDDRDCDRDGDIDSGSCDTRRGGLGGFIDSLLGTGGLRVGQRASGNLYAVPYEYRGRYRDSSNYVYRSDGRQIYQIDARSGVVMRVHPMP
jgi:hypothetical protein